MKNESVKKSKYQCPKCSNTICEIGEMRVAGGFWSKIFNIQAKRFTTVTCSQCNYTELYRGGSAGAGENVLDFFGN